MINVLHLRDTDRVCGPGKTIIETARAATPGEFHHKVGLLLLAGEGPNQYQQAAERKGVDILPIRATHKLDPRIVWNTLQAVKTHKIDIIHSHDYKSDMIAWAVARLRRIPIMSTVHGWIWNNRRYQLYWRISQSLLPKFDLVVAVSEETRRAVLACGVPAAKVELIHNAIVAENYSPAVVPRGEIRRQFGIPADARVIGCIGRLSFEKGQRDLLTAARQILQTHPHVWFVFAGDGPDRPFVEQQAADSGIAHRVVFAGHLSDVRPLFQDLDILALTSHTEGFPNVVLESFCMDRPVLATDVGGVREVVEDRVTGRLIEAHEPDHIVSGLLELLDQPFWAASLAAAGKARVMEQFTFRRRVAREEALTRVLLQDRAL
jgi:glycosyltransferase involved in cell wall biosynthesis